MKRALPIALAVLLAVVGCTQKTDEERVESALHNNPFFKTLGAVPRNDGYNPGGGMDGDTTWPVGAWRSVRDPKVGYDITVEHPYATVDFHADWPCTLYVVYTDLPDTSIRDTVIKPAPEFHGDLSFRFLFDGHDWQLTDLAPVEAKFDSAVGLIAIDSVQVSVLRGGTLIPYPTLDAIELMPVNPYVYSFRPGDAVSLRLWETHAPQVQFPWTYLHGPPGHEYSPFQYDETNGSWYGSWTIGSATGHDDGNWVWFEILDLHDAIINPDGPDRSVLWGVPYVVE